MVCDRRRTIPEGNLRFPAVSHQWSAKPIWDSLQRMDHLRCVWRFKLCLTCLSDEDTLRSMPSSIAQYFPHVSNLEFVVRERNIHLNPHVVSSAQSLISNLRVLVVGFDVDHRLPEAYQKDKAGLAGAWRVCCPNLLWVRFPDDSRVQYDTFRQSGSGLSIYTVWF